MRQSETGIPQILNTTSIKILQVVLRRVIRGRAAVDARGDRLNSFRVQVQIIAIAHGTAKIIGNGCREGTSQCFGHFSNEPAVLLMLILHNEWPPSAASA